VKEEGGGKVEGTVYMIEENIRDDEGYVKIK
jgi:hypothetical protein